MTWLLFVYRLLTPKGWYYVGLLVATIVAILWASHDGSSRQAAKDAPVIAAAKASGALATKQSTNTSQRAAHEATLSTKEQDHVSEVQAAPDSDAAFRAYLRGLHDGHPSPPLPGGPGAKAAPPAPR